MCLGYYNERVWDQQPKAEQDALMDECFACDDDVRRKGGHFAGGAAPGPSRDSKPLRWRYDDVAVSDGPFSEAKEVLGRALMLAARDLVHAVERMKKHPARKAGNLSEIRASADLTPMRPASEARRSKNKSR